ncbi:MULTISPECIES: WXG100 family type VII secretion target [unclassified Enterococcus]|uniref:WXG100 family type VII secretion target n=1 Tax=unclassified Enterococcus TaxID=2608891 RepID=UPI0015546F0E|nr:MULTISPECIES: WXG100 family type VII secretion target [unclassified Enterococcus]MBS7576546.1 WXG100 family type VII secretion target [Enterococcus sp. MMGLQ5-2]MBS7583967.1 WXG100 family type VII secretion target [Enterococcus sp. MMGLQ5-1]NPD11828.1 hypothetical protein [Enterococcus sp. MMGLQ5-1]NPD36383.1 hypothetical protein [Enterococcus sp. MMGLQ5-2]
MTDKMQVNTGQVNEIAGKIEGLNKQMLSLLEDSQQQMNQLADTWNGQAAESTIGAYNQFSKRYFQSYHDILASYVLFLRNNVAQSYEAIETENINLSETLNS